MLVGAGGNITVQVGSMGVLLVDTGLAQFSDKVIAAVRTLSDKPIHYIINTHVHPDHVGGNETLAKIGGGSAREVTLVNTPGETAAYSVQIIAHQNVFDRMSAPANSKKAIPKTRGPRTGILAPRKKCTSMARRSKCSIRRLLTRMATPSPSFAAPMYQHWRHLRHQRLSDHRS